MVTQVEAVRLRTGDIMSRTKPVKYTIKVTVEKYTDTYGTQYDVRAEGSGFVGESNGGFGLGSTFEKAYEDLMAKVSEAIFVDDK